MTCAACSARIERVVRKLEGVVNATVNLATEKLYVEYDAPLDLRAIKEAVTGIGYHGALDHYGVSLGDGNLFEWAKDMSANDKDIVFVLNPAPFIAAGVDPNKVDGWAFAKVTVDDENDKPIEVDKLLKPFNLK
jgi:copper chaperone CopZ